MQRPGLKTVFFYLPHELHKQLKESALKNNTSITQLVQDMIKQHLFMENQHDDTQ
jgi:hypothetical protein